MLSYYDIILFATSFPTPKSRTGAVSVFFRVSSNQGGNQKNRVDGRNLFEE